MITIILIIIIVLVGLGILEYYFHWQNLKIIPLRIHVNGTRGKSSVTRLIAGALRENGLKTFAKTTGTLPRMIMEDGREYPVYRPSKANIIEQLRIVSLAAHHKADALVVECMALRPHLQSLTELKLIKTTHGVITNVRADHLDVMGPSEKEVALALLGTTPRQAKLFTCEQDYLSEFHSVCRDRNTELTVVDKDEIEQVKDEEMAGFKYVEHKENVALTLKVCDLLGVSRETAIRGMWKARPDPGVMSEYKLSFFGRNLWFVNGFAANDPESSERIWNIAIERHSEIQHRIMVINCRADRPDRSYQLGQAIVNWSAADTYVMIGSGVYIMVRTAVAQGFDASKFVYAEGLSAEGIFEEIIGLSGKSALIVGIGNIAGAGLELVSYFRNRAEEI